MAYAISSEYSGRLSTDLQVGAGSPSPLLRRLWLAVRGRCVLFLVSPWARTGPFPHQLEGLGERYILSTLGGFPCCIIE